MDQKEIETKIKKIAEGFAELIELGGWIIEQLNGEPTPVPVEVETTAKKKTTKKATKKKTSKNTTKKSSPAEGTAKEVVEVDTTISFTAGVTPKGAKEQRIFKEQWAALSEEQQKQYFKGEIDSLGTTINNNSVSELNSNPSEEVSPTKPTQDDVRSRLRAYASENGADKAKAILAQFKAAKISDLKESDFPKVIEATNA